jgi:hypothetical protein
VGGGPQSHVLGGMLELDDGLLELDDGLLELDDTELELDDGLLLDGLLLDGLLELDEGLLELEDELGSSQQHAIDAGSGIMCTSPLRSKCLHFATRMQLLS